MSPLPSWWFNPHVCHPPFSDTAVYGAGYATRGTSSYPALVEAAAATSTDTPLSWAWVAQQITITRGTAGVTVAAVLGTDPWINAWADAEGPDAASAAISFHLALVSGGGFPLIANLSLAEADYPGTSYQEVPTPPGNRVEHYFEFEGPLAAAATWSLHAGVLLTTGGGMAQAEFVASISALEVTEFPPWWQRIDWNQVRGAVSPSGG